MAEDPPGSHPLQAYGTRRPKTPGVADSWRQWDSRTNISIRQNEKSFNFICLVPTFAVLATKKVVQIIFSYVDEFRSLRGHPEALGGHLPT